MAVPVSAVKTASLLNRISVISIGFLALTIVVFAGLFFYLSKTSSAQVDNISKLKAKITSLQQNEQKLVLAKDRLAKIKVVQDARSVGNEVGRFRDFSKDISNSGSVVTEATLNNNGTEVSLISSSSDILSSLLTPLSTIIDYKKVILKSLSYNATTGFISTILLESE